MKIDNTATNETIAKLIRKAIADAQVEVTGDGRHFEAIVISSDFASKTRVARHQLVYKALGERMQSEIHALSLKTLTPTESANNQNGSTN